MTGPGVGRPRGEKDADAHVPKWHGMEVMEFGARRNTFNQVGLRSELKSAEGSQAYWNHEPSLLPPLSQIPCLSGFSFPPPRNPVEFISDQSTFTACMLRVPGFRNPDTKGCREPGLNSEWRREKELECSYFLVKRKHKPCGPV